MIDFLMMEHLTYATLAGFNAGLFEMLGNPPEVVGVSVSRWDGTVSGIPDAWPVFMHASPHILCTRAELAAACKRLGHVPFYNDVLVGLDGRLYPDALKVAVRAFLDTQARAAETRERGKKKKIKAALQAFRPPDIRRSFFILIFSFVES